MYITINYPLNEDLTSIEGADVIEWIDDKTVALEIDFDDLQTQYRYEKSFERHEAEGEKFVETLHHVDIIKCKWGSHHVINEHDVEYTIVQLKIEGVI